MRLTLRLLLAVCGSLLLGGCGTFRGWAQMGSGGPPRLGTSVNLPLGSGGGK